MESSVSATPGSDRAHRLIIVCSEHIPRRPRRACRKRRPSYWSGVSEHTESRVQQLISSDHLFDRGKTSIRPNGQKSTVCCVVYQKGSTHYIPRNTRGRQKGHSGRQRSSISRATEGLRYRRSDTSAECRLGPVLGQSGRWDKEQPAEVLKLDFRFIE